MSGAGPSSSGGHSSASHVDGESLALMRRLQEEDDAAQLMAQEPGLQPHALGLQPRTRPAVRRVHPATLHSWRFTGVRTWLGLEPRRGALILTLTITLALTRCAHSRRCRAGSTAGGSGPPVGGGLEQPPAAQWTAPDCEDGELDTRCAGAQARGAPRSQRNMANVPPSRATVSLLPGLLHVFRRRASNTQAPVSAHGVAVKRAPKSPMVTAFDHLGNTAKRIALEFKTDGSVLSLLTLLDSAQRPRVLELVDGGQRARVEAEWLG